MWDSKQKFDAVVGDTTIGANRSKYVDFTLPYTESGLTMIVLAKNNKGNAWIFLKPLRLDLWLMTGAAFIFTGAVVWALEHRVNDEFRGPLHNQAGVMLWFSFSTLVFAQSSVLRPLLIISLHFTWNHVLAPIQVRPCILGPGPHLSVVEARKLLQLNWYLLSREIFQLVAIQTRMFGQGPDRIA